MLVSEYFSGFDDDNIASDKSNGDYEALKDIGEPACYDPEADSSTSIKLPLWLEPKSFIDHWKITNPDE